jgi:hypothetical protein
MATPVIKLEPIRMGSLVGNSLPLAPGQKYLPPGMRSKSSDTGPVKVDLGVDNFPTLGSTPKKTGGWGNHVIKSSPLASSVPDVAIHAPESPISENMKDKIKEHIRQAQLEEEERQKPREEDPYKMTREELLMDGWAILSLNKEEVRQVRWRMNTPAVKVAPTSEDYYE